LALSVFEPNILISEANCGTTLGKFQTINFEAEGLTELATETVISYTRINELLSQGVYSAATRHTSTCISKEGVCVRCYKATYPNKPVPKVLDRVNITPNYLVNAQVIRINTFNQNYDIETDSTMYDSCDVFMSGQLLVEGVDYIISGNIITILKVVTEDTNVVLRMMSYDRSPYLSWLSYTYSGSLLGVKPLAGEQLMVRPLFLSSTLLENRLQSISEYVKASVNIPEDYSKYSDQIVDPLEKALYMLAIFTIYYNVTS